MRHKSSQFDEAMVGRANSADVMVLMTCRDTLSISTSLGSKKRTEYCLCSSRKRESSEPKGRTLDVSVEADDDDWKKVGKSPAVGGDVEAVATPVVTSSDAETTDARDAAAAVADVDDAEDDDVNDDAEDGDDA